MDEGGAASQPIARRVALLHATMGTPHDTWNHHGWQPNPTDPAVTCASTRNLAKFQSTSLWSASWPQGSVALSPCTTARPFYTRFAKRFGGSISEGRDNATELYLAVGVLHVGLEVLVDRVVEGAALPRGRKPPKGTLSALCTYT